MFKRKTIIPIKLHKIEDEGYHIVVEVNINRKKANLIIDPGASRTVFDENSIKDYTNIEKATLINRRTTGVGTEQIQAKRIVINSLDIGDIEIEGYLAAAVNLTSLNEHYKQLHFKPVHGLLGGDILKEFKAIINYKKMTLTLYHK